MPSKNENSNFIFAAGDKYDRQTGAWSRLVAPGFIEFMQIQDGDSVLDVGCGTGILSLALAEKTTASRIAGIDLSNGFIDYARTKSGDPRLCFETGDAQSLPYDDNTFDRALAMLVIQFVPDKVRAISEMKRVTKPGGAIGTAFWDFAGGMEPNRALWQAAKATDPNAAIPSSGNLAFGSPKESTKLFSDVRLKDIVVAEIIIERRFTSLDDYWIPLATSEGVPGKYLGSLSQERKSAVREQLRRNLLGDETDGSFSINGRAWATRGIIT